MIRVKELLNEVEKRIARKPGQHKGSSKHSDLYTDENPKGTIHGLKFATVKDAEASVNKIKASGKSHAHKMQAAIAMEQRAKAAGKTTAAGVYRSYINSIKKSEMKLTDILKEATSKTNAEELERVEGLLSKAHKDNAYSVMSSYEYRISMLKLLTQLEKKNGKKLPLFQFKYTVLDYLQKYFPGFKGKFGPYNQKWSLVAKHIQSALEK